VLSTMARPRGGDWLSDEMEALSSSGVGVLVSTLTPSEEAELDLSGESASAVSAGLEYISFPIQDRGVPEATMFRELVRKLRAALEGGSHVVIHCRMGIGRSSLVAAGVLVAEGTEGPAAWAAISDARGLPVPDTEAQRDWLNAVNDSQEHGFERP
jgi:protein-tyrosine phosphatase